MRARFAAYPNSANVIAAHMKPAMAPKTGPLGGDIIPLNRTSSEQPLCDRGIEASGDGVFDDCTQMVAEERANLEGCISTLCMRTNHTNVDPTGPVSERIERKHFLRRCQSDPQPSRSIVDPGGIKDIARFNAQQLSGPIQFTLYWRAGTDQRRGGKRKPPLHTPDRDQTGAAFLNDFRRLLRHPTRREPDMTAPSVGCPAKGISLSSVNILTR